MQLNFGSHSMEIKDAIRQLKSNIKWLKCRVLVASKDISSGHFVQFYTQKIAAQEELIACLSKYDRTHSPRATR